MNATVKTTVAVLALGAMFIAVILLFASLGIAHPIPWMVLAALIAIPFISNWRESRHFVTWKDDYSVGIESIDNDHKKLLQLINQLQTATYYHIGRDFELQALDAVIDYTRYHFDHEEALMEQAQYDQLASHKAEHQQMIDKVSEMKAHYEARGHEALEDLALYLKTWLINHINGTDQAYSAILISRGIQ